MTASRRPETRIIRGKRIRIERGTVQPLRSLPAPEIVLGAVEPLGPVAQDCAEQLRGRERFPLVFLPTAMGQR